jgi:serine/threonine protein kinase
VTANGSPEQDAEIDASQTLEARIEANLDFAKTVEQRPSETIQPKREPVGAADALARLAELSKKSLSQRLISGATLGVGGMGVVRLAEQVSLGRSVAVKTLRPSEDARDSSVEQTAYAALRALREAWVTGSLEHPNIVPIYDVDVDEHGAPVIVMKRIEGRPWTALLEDPDLVREKFSTQDPVEWHLRVLLSVCNAVHFAHTKGIIHRDLKPDNVMIGAFGEVYVLDWGIAVSVTPDPTGRLPDRAFATEIAGTPNYMAPEQLEQVPERLTPRTDVYLIGAMLYELFAGQPPHCGENVQQIFASIIQSKIEYPQGFPAEAKAIAERALARRPEDRFEDAAALKAAIEAYLQHRGSRRLAFRARKSLERLLELMTTEPPSADRSAAVFNLLGECRFGFRAALEAWPDNSAARQGLDKALVAVIEAELSGGDALAAQALARELSSIDPALTQRIERAVQERAAEDERLRKLADDYDMQAGTRTRMALGVAMGLTWTVLPLIGALVELRGGSVSYRAIGVAMAGFTVFGAVFRYWARESMSRTHVNRGLSATMAVQLVVQFMLLGAASTIGLAPQRVMTLFVLTWTLTKLLVAVWVERWFITLAALDALCFFVASGAPSTTLWLMSLTNLAFTLAVVRLWLPQQDRARIQERRAEFRARTRKLLLGVTQPEPAAQGTDEG